MQTMISNSINRSALLQGWGELLSQWDWDWFMTLTFGKPVGLWAADRRFIELLRAIRKDVRHNPLFFRVTEMQKFRNVPHYHCFMGEVKGVDGCKYATWWHERYGSARIYDYDRNKGARFYLAKDLAKEGGDFKMSRSLKKILIPSVVAESPNAIIQPQHPRQKLSG